jgi:hypothetical protein
MSVSDFYLSFYGFIEHVVLEVETTGASSQFYDKFSEPVLVYD